MISLKLLPTHIRDKNMRKIITMAVVSALFLAVTLTSCGGGGLPNGRYEPIDDTMKASWVQAIIIDGDNFTTVFPITGQGITVKYKYTDGTITFTDGVATAGVACEYKDGLLYYAGIPFSNK
jgi:hypothetical protein